MYAVLVAVEISPGRYEESLRALDEYIIPMCKGAPGFVRGTWFGSQESGNSLMLFDSEESARQFAAQVRSNPDDPVNVTGTEVYQVEREA
jgi:hypothetical protein